MQKKQQGSKNVKKHDKSFLFLLTKAYWKFKINSCSRTTTTTNISNDTECNKWPGKIFYKNQEILYLYIADYDITTTQKLFVTQAVYLLTMRST